MDISKFYLFTRTDTGVSVMPKRGTEAPKDTSTGSRWDDVARPRKKSMTLWNGDDPRTMDVPILLDGFFKSASVEIDCDKISHMRLAPSDFTQPPQVAVQGALPITGINWIIVGIDWGDNVIWHDNGFRMRQDAVIHLKEYVPPDALSIRPAATSHIHIVKPGETLKGIAKLELGDAKLAAALAKINNIRDPKHLKTGQRIVIPPITGL